MTNENGDEVTIHIQEAILKCDDGWFVDYVLLPDEISGIGSPEAVGTDIGVGWCGYSRRYSTAG